MSYWRVTAKEKCYCLATNSTVFFFRVLLFERYTVSDIFMIK